MKLWEINDAIEVILASTAATGGELTEEQEKQLDELDLNLQEKLLHCALYYQGELAEAKAIEAMGKKLMARAKSHASRAEWLLGYMERHAPKDEKFRIRDARVEVKWGKSERVESVFDDLRAAIVSGEIDPKYVREKIEQSIDKAAAKPVLKAGTPIRGLKLVEHTMLRVTPRAGEEG